jgi:urease
LNEIEQDAKSMLGEKVLQPGISKMIGEICIEGTFKDGVKTIRISNPICSEYGNLELALYGSFLPVPNKELFDVSIDLLF